MSRNECCIVELTVDKVPKNTGGPGRILTILNSYWNFSEIELQIISRKGAINKDCKLEFKNPFKARLKRRLKQISPSAFMFAKIYYNYYYIYKKLKQISLRKFTVFHAHDIIAFRIAKDFAKKYKVSIPILLTIHSPGSTTYEICSQVGVPITSSLAKWFGKFFEKYAIENCFALILPSFGMYNIILDQLQLMDLSVTKHKPDYIIYNGIPWKKDLSAYLDSNFILAIGRLTYSKGFDILIKAYAKSRQEKRDLPELWIVGEGESLKDLKNLVYTLGLQGSVKFLGFRKDCDVLLSNAKFFVAPNRTSAFDLVILEALRAGCPVIASNIGGNPEAITQEVGRLFPVEDIDVLSKLIVELSSNEELLRKMSENAIKYFQQTFNASKMVSHYKECYKKIIKEFYGI